MRLSSVVLLLSVVSNQATTSSPPVDPNPPPADPNAPADSNTGGSTTLPVDTGANSPPAADPNAPADSNTGGSTTLPVDTGANSPPAADPNAPAATSTCSADYNNVYSGVCRDATSKLCTPGDACNDFFIKAKTSCADSTFENSNLKVLEEQCATVGMTPFQKNCEMIKGCCNADSFGQCPFMQSSGNDGSLDSKKPQSCKNSELGVGCTACSDECKDAEVLKLNSGSESFNLFAGNALQNICTDKQCTPKYFKSLISYTDEMMKPTCQVGGEGATRSELKTVDVFDFMCTTNKAGGYCLKHLMSRRRAQDSTDTNTGGRTLPADANANGTPQPTPAPAKLDCTNSDVVKMKDAGCCVGTFVAMLANGQNQTISADFESQILEVSDECGLNIVPCGQGAIVDVVQVKAKIDLSGVSVDAVRANKQAFKKAIADEVGVKPSNVIITGVNSVVTSRHRDRILNGAASQVSYAVTVPQSGAAQNSNTLETKVNDIGSTNAQSFGGKLQQNGLATSGASSAGVASATTAKAEGIAASSADTSSSDGSASGAVAGNTAMMANTAPVSLAVAVALALVASTALTL